MAPDPDLDPVSAVFLKVDDKHCVHCREIRHEPRNSGCELCDGSAVACCGHWQVFDSVNRLLLEVPVFRVCGGVVCGAVGGTCLILNQEEPLPVGGG